jgi:hypothetical protein
MFTFSAARPIFLIFLVCIISVNFLPSVAMEVSQERNWRKSLNIEFVGYINTIPQINEWIKSNEQYVSEAYKNQHIQTLMSEDIMSCNTATAQFKLLFVVEGSDTLQIITINPSHGKISLSGQKKFKDNLLEEIKKQILSGQSSNIDPHDLYLSTSKTENGKRCDYFKRGINNLIEEEVVKEGGHAEAYLLLHLHHVLPELLRYCISKHPAKNIRILGAILVIASLKDPCDKNCFPMLIKFNQKLPVILNSILNSSNIFQPISLAPILERILLVGAKEHHQAGSDPISTRHTYPSHGFNDKIYIDFTNPQTRVFSATFADLD